MAESRPPEAADPGEDRYGMTLSAAEETPRPEEQITFDAICRVWDQAVAHRYPRQESLRLTLVDLQEFLGLTAVRL